MLHTSAVRKVAIVGYNRIPFARQNTAYAKASNRDMLVAALNGLIVRFNLKGELLGEVACGALIKHSREFNLTRESVMSTSLNPLTPACDLQQACDTRIETAIYIANKIALGQIDAGIAGDVDSTSNVPLIFEKKLSNILLAANRAKSFGGKLSQFFKTRPGYLAPIAPAALEPRTGKCHCVVAAYRRIVISVIALIIMLFNN